MSRTKRPKPIYQRGKFSLHRRTDRTNLKILWYDEGRKRERSRSAGTTDAEEGIVALDRLYLETEGRPVCPTCHRPWTKDGPGLASAAIADYLVLSEGKAGYDSARYRLNHVLEYIIETDAAVACTQIDEAWIERFRRWALARPVTSSKGKILRDRSLAHVEGSVMQFAAAINATQSIRAAFKALPMQSVANSPTFRADIQTMAAMFLYALERPERANLLRFLRAAVATWARPDAIHDIAAAQWTPGPRILALNPATRRQTKKFRPTIVIARQFARHLDELRGQYIAVESIRESWRKMGIALALPSGANGGTKLIRRSVATIARGPEYLGEEHWVQGRIMLGHHRATTSDIYALPNPAHLGRALAATEAIIDQIEQLTPGAYRAVTATNQTSIIEKDSKNG